MPDEFLHTTLGRTGLRVFRLGLSGSYRPGEAALREGIEAGMNYLFWFAWDRQMIRVLREVLPGRREQFVVATGAGRVGPWLFRKSIEHHLRKLRTDYIDVYHIAWLADGRLNPRIYEILQRAKEQGKIRHIGISTHARRYAGELIRQGRPDVIMMRYNAAHRGAEEEIFPALPASQPGVVSYTATRWRALLKRPKRWGEGERVPSAGDCYRFVLSNPNVHVCLTAPRSAEQLRENLAAVRLGSLAEEDMAFMRRFGDAVHAERRFFL